MTRQRVAKGLRLSGVAAMVGVILLGPIALAWRESDLDRWRTLIPASSQVFAVIETVKGNQVTLRTLNTVSSPDNLIRLPFNSLVSATAFPSRPDAMRQEICVTRVQPFVALAMNKNAFMDRNGLHCLGSIADARGTIGLPMETIKPETVVTIRLNGDWTLDTKETGEQP
ncbi:hypothetical protein [Insolitispirillum peregrinum]|uniref:Uncharacterized protein n=1 Tax=Insolitispirillum peregrinum TaxID=80876 RepID=A0A1N7MFG4_9PROT|nr:hypothetical protein [Insolitispirillum peregrinum]SIS84721.1 hypothetical protein SAMN05421779_10485 [Insolitispirillum peregrinum]